MTHLNPLPLIDKWFTSFIDFLKEKNIFAILMLFVILSYAGMSYIIYAQNERIGDLNVRWSKVDSVLIARDNYWRDREDRNKDRYQGKIDSMTAQQIKDQSATIRRLNAIDSARNANEAKFAVATRQVNSFANRASSIKRKTDSLDKMLKKKKE